MFPPETKILVVDDMKTMRMVIKKALANLGLNNVTDVDDGATAWPELEKSLVEQKPYQLIISDWTMPKMTGLELLKKVRAHPKLGATSFLMVTAESDAAQVKEAVTAGVSNYITKPFSADTIKEKLKAIYDRIKK